MDMILLEWFSLDLNSKGGPNGVQPGAVSSRRIFGALSTVVP